MLDDCSRYIVALEAYPNEREKEMLRVLVHITRCSALVIALGWIYQMDSFDKQGLTRARNPGTHACG